MSIPSAVTVELSEEERAFIERKIDAGVVPNAGALLHAALAFAIEDDADMERWLREDVVPTIERMEKDPSRAIPVDEVFEKLRRRIDADVAAAKAAE
jgi:antitoxin ParD1/3/4